MRVWLTRRRRSACPPDFVEPARPFTIPEIPPRSRRVYRDGTYLISAFGGARTWAVHNAGRWGVVYELGGDQPVAAWVADAQIPLEVRAQALQRREDRAR